MLTARLASSSWPRPNRDLTAVINCRNCAAFGGQASGLVRGSARGPHAFGDVSFKAAPLVPQNSLRRAEGDDTDRRRLVQGRQRLGRDIGRRQRRHSRSASFFAALSIEFCENLIDGEERGWRTVRGAVGGWDQIALSFGRGRLCSVSAGSRGMQADRKHEGRRDGRRAELRPTFDAVGSSSPTVRSR